MRHLILIFIVLFVFSNAKAQDTEWHVKFNYDNSGNRIERRMVEVELKSASIDGNEAVEPIVENFGKREVKIYPNPTRGALKIEITGGEEDAQYQMHLYDNRGKQLMSDKVNAPGEKQLNLYDYASGVYIMRLFNREETLTFKIIKE